MMRAARSSRATLAIASALVPTLWLAVASALVAAPASTIELGSQRTADYARDAVGTFRPVRLSLVEEVLGDGALDGERTYTTTGTDPDPVDAPQPDPEPTAKPTADPDPAPTPSTTPKGGRLDEPELSIRMVSDRHTVDPGQRITYTIEVTNVGGTAAGNGRITTHVPEGTRYIGDDLCGDAVEVNPRRDGPVVCASTEHVVDPDDPGEHFGPTLSALPPGQTLSYSFMVRVLETVEPGTRLVTHAHARAAGAETVHSRVCWVKVT